MHSVSFSFDEGVMSVVCTDQQLGDLNRFCAYNGLGIGSIGIDPTFNLSDFYVTSTIYEHKLVINKVTGRHPYFISPVFIHQDRKFATYYSVASQLKKLHPEIDSFAAIGTDGEEALSSAFMSVFPSSIHLLCSIHKRDNITRKLHEFKIEDAPVMADIFGSRVDDACFEGLVDSESSEDFMDK